MLCALDFYLASPVQIAILGSASEEETKSLVRTLYDYYLPNKVVAVGARDSSPLLADRDRIDGHATAYVCEHFACRTPVTEPQRLAEELATHLTA
jgi:uncharacterized protein YyaL (SSP411 family)